MSHEVDWTRQLLNDFIHEAMLTEEEVFLMETRMKGMPVSRQAMELNRSESSVHQMISRVKKKYDIVQKAHPDKFPKRRVSKEERYMDTH